MPSHSQDRFKRCIKKLRKEEEKFESDNEISLLNKTSTSERKNLKNRGGKFNSFAVQL